MTPIEVQNLVLAANEQREVDADADGFIFFSASADFEISVNDQGQHPWFAGVSWKGPNGVSKIRVIAPATGLTAQLVIYSGQVDDNRLSLEGGLQITSMPDVTVAGVVLAKQPNLRLLTDVISVGQSVVQVWSAGFSGRSGRISAGMLDLMVARSAAEITGGRALLVPAGGSVELPVTERIMVARPVGTADCQFTMELQT